MGVAISHKKKILYINFLNRITKDCDCMGQYEKIMPDIGVLISSDPVALDAASLQLVEDRAGQKLSQVTFNIPYKVQLEYAEELGLGRTKYELIPA